MGGGWLDVRSATLCTTLKRLHRNPFCYNVATNKLTLSNRRPYLVIGIIIILLTLGLTAFIKRDGILRRIYSYQVRSELAEQLKPLQEPLKALGFTNLPKPKATCSSIPNMQTGKSESTCTATISKYIVIGRGETVTKKINKSAAWLDSQFSANGWKQRKDLPTIAWFNTISQGVDYQPDQLNIKQLNTMTCTIDFFTAFSKPSEPAINLVATCEKPAMPQEVFGSNF